MAHPFDGIRVKILRAEQIVDQVRAEITALVEKHYRVTQRRYHESRVTVFVETSAAPADFTRLSIFVGEVVYQLRSALDHAFWLLIAGEPLDYDGYRGFIFPICKTENDFNSQCCQKKWTLVEGAEAAIRGMQPYCRGKEYRLDPLWILNELSVMDRHRLLTTTMFGAGLPWSDLNCTYVVPFDPSTPIAFQHDPATEVDVKAVAMVSVKFAEDWLFQQQVAPLLDLLISTTKDIIDSLAPLLPKASV